jgi:nucleoside-diphosphate-sugar epimerase
VEPNIGPARPGDIVHSQASIDLARGALGYEPVVSFHEGIKRTVAWYLGTAGKPAPSPDLSPAPGA